MPSDDRSAVQAGADVKVMLTLRLAEALGDDSAIVDFDDLCDRVRALAAPSPPVDREALATIAHGEHQDISTTSIRDIPSPWQAVEDALDRLISAGVVAQSPTAQDGAEFIGEPHWRIVTEVPLRLPQEDRDEILGLITDTAASWAEQARDTGDDWDANVYGYVQPATPSIPVSCVGQEVEWNVEDSVWTPGRVESLTENTAVITVHDNGERLVVEKRFLRARASSREAGQP